MDGVIEYSTRTCGVVSQSQVVNVYDVIICEDEKMPLCLDVCDV
jgi:hypothetical protein